MHESFHIVVIHVQMQLSEENTEPSAISMPEIHWNLSPT